MDEAGNVNTVSQAIETENPYIARDYILAGKNISTRTDFSTILATNTTGTIYQAEDDDGTTYYYAGAPTDNWVKFAGFYWRIIRINGDGTLRLIYQGTSANIIGTGTLTHYQAFNTSWNDNAYSGFKYTIGSLRGIGTNSTVLTKLNMWYSDNLSSYASYIDTNAGFCNDRTPSTDSNSLNNSGGTGSTITYYATYIRLITNKDPTFKCTNSNDLFTMSSSNKGNRGLTYPIGFITADEVAFAGGVYGQNNTSYYLFVNYPYWTMSPHYFDSGGARLFSVERDGNLGGTGVTNDIGTHPVINLKSDVRLTGSGTSTNPYTVVE